MRILVTAGPTREYFDTVRFISNPSSGRMGYAIAASARARGHGVVLVTGPVAVAAPRGVEVVPVTTAHEMYLACRRLFVDCDAAVMTAAVCDYRPSRRLAHKLRKSARIRPVRLLPTRDICSALGAVKGARVVIGFAMEDHDHRAHAAAKLRRKRCDAMVLNGPGNVGGDRAEVEVLTADGQWSPPMRGTKRSIAARVVALTERLHAAKASKRFS